MRRYQFMLGRDGVYEYPTCETGNIYHLMSLLLQAGFDTVYWQEIKHEV